MYTRYGRRRKLTAEETAANAAKREARNKAAMHCQCCGRSILANTGAIAHHGYERPGEGWQTASCMGARHLPFEASREALGALIDMLTERVKMATDHLAVVTNETKPYRVTYTDNRERIWDHIRKRKVEQTTTIEVTRETFEALYAEHKPKCRYSSLPYSFDTVKDKAVRKAEYELKRLADWRAECQKRFDGWKQTHEWKNDQWVAL